MAFRSQTKEGEARMIIDVLKSRIAHRARKRAPITASASNEEKLQNYIDDTQHVSEHISYDTLAADKGLDIPETQRIVDTVFIAFAVFFGAYDKKKRLANIWKIMDPHQTATTNPFVWPEDNLDHSSELSHAVKQLKKSPPLGPNLVMIRRADLEALAGGASQLAHKIRNHHASLGYAVPAAEFLEEGLRYSSGNGKRKQAPSAPGAQEVIPLSLGQSRDAVAYQSNDHQAPPLQTLPQRRSEHQPVQGPQGMLAAQGPQAKKHPRSQSATDSPSSKKTKVAPETHRVANAEALGLGSQPSAATSLLPSLRRVAKATEVGLSDRLEALQRRKLPTRTRPSRSQQLML